MSAIHHSGVYVFSERQDVALELLSVARPVSAETHSFVASLVIGPNARADAEERIAHGSDRVFILRDPRLEGARGDLVAEALSQAVGKLHPDVIIVGATRGGIEVAARLAQRLGVGCASDCLKLQAKNGELIIEKRYYGGKFVARRVMAARPRIVTIPPRRFEAPPKVEGRRGDIEELDVVLTDSAMKLVGTEPRTKSGVEIGKAEIVVSVGRGLKRAEDVAIVRELADTLGAVVGASRPLTAELRWLPVDVQVGLSGTTVKPKLYIACGISGQIEHLVGMRGSGVVVAINTDPNAPIMQEADYRVIGDLYEVVPALSRALRQMRK
jgi:electron transfer flavoprotein alpha subunit